MTENTTDSYPIYTLVRVIRYPVGLRAILISDKPYELLFVKEHDGYWRMVGDECYSATDEQFVNEYPEFEVLK